MEIQNDSLSDAETASTKSDISTDSEDPLARYASLLSRIESRTVLSLAMRVRQNHLKGNGHEADIRYHEGTVIQPPNCGSFNLIYTIEFSDGLKWVLRIPAPGEHGRFTPTSSRNLRSEAMTMSFLRKNTAIPIPKIFDFDETTNNEIGAPYILMDFAEGQRVSELWFDTTGPTPLEQRRLRILDTVAMAMSQLCIFQFDKIGSLQFDSDDLSPTRIGPCNVLDAAADLTAMYDGLEPVLTFRKIGPFDTSREYFEALLSMHDTPEYEYAIGMRQLLRMMLQSIPPSFSTKIPQTESESFVLAYPDFASQNVLISENGTLTALLDWDDIQTVPRCIGYSRFPNWITRDWNPLRYGYDDPDSRQENSPNELEYYRSRYAKKMRTLMSQTFDFTMKSHLFEALWIAVSSPACTSHIVEKIFTYLFPEDLEHDPIYLYETVMGLAKKTIDGDVESRIRKAFEHLLAYPLQKSHEREFGANHINLAEMISNMGSINGDQEKDVGGGVRL